MKKSAKKNSPAETTRSKEHQMAYNQEVNQLAYQLWEEAGGHHGDDLRHWLEAERRVNSAGKKNAKPGE